MGILKEPHFVDSFGCDIDCIDCKHQSDCDYNEERQAEDYEGDDDGHS